MNNDARKPNGVEVRIAQPDGSVKAFTVDPSKPGKLSAELKELHRAQQQDRSQIQPKTYYVRYTPKGGEPEEYLVSLPRPVITRGGVYLLIEEVRREREARRLDCSDLL